MTVPFLLPCPVFAAKAAYAIGGYAAFAANNISAAQASLAAGNGAGYATSGAQALNLARQLTSEEQLAQALSGNGTPLIGAGTGKTLLDAETLASQYGGDPSDWAKMGCQSSAVHDVQTPAGNNFEIH